MAHARTLLSLRVTLLLLPLLAVTARPDEPKRKPITEYLQPLRDRQAQLQTIRKELVRLQEASEDEEEYDDEESAEAEQRASEIQELGRELLTEGLALQGTLRSFLAGETRRGLGMEIDLVRDNVHAVHEMLVDYRQLRGQTITPLTDAAGKDELRKWILKLLRQELQKRIARRFDDAGIREILRSDSFEEALRNTLGYLESRAWRPVDEQMQALTGLAFHDGRSLRRAAKQVVNQTIADQVMRLVVSLSSERLVIKLGEKILVPWIQEAFWKRVVPKIKEAVRQRGKQEQRLRDTKEGFEKLARQLKTLPKDTLLVDVKAALARARAAVTATAYLEHDLKRAGKQKGVKALQGAIGLLEQAISFTEKRFLLHQEDLVSRLRLDQEVLADALDELARLLRGTKTPEAGRHLLLFLQPHQFPGEKGPVEPPRLEHVYEGRASFDNAVLLCVDRRLLKAYREELRERESPNAEASLPELYASHSGLAREYRQDWVLRVTAGGQTIFYHRVRGRYDTRGFGLGKLLGLKPGKNKIAATLATSEGLRTDMTLTLVVQISPTFAEAVAKNRREISRSQEYLQKHLGAQPTVASVADWATRHFELLENRAHLLGAGGQGGAADLLALAQELLKLTDQIGRQGSGVHPSTVADHLMKILRVCGEVGTADAYSFAAGDLFTRLVAVAPAMKEDGLRLLANASFDLAHLAISGGNQVDAARKHYVNYLRLALEVGEELDADLERRLMPKRW
ncbi:MAG: hypothetical protein ACYTEZ_14500 [Planctomycetota bacterium]|jgi:hypothetical protein